MKNYVIINGTNSNTITGLMINELPPITKPPLRVQTEEIDGRDGDITTPLGYSAYDKTYTIGLFGTGYDINDIISFFNDSGTIVFSNEPDKYYYFKTINKIDYERLQIFKTASITIHCQPFKYPTEETPLEIEYQYISEEGENITLNPTEEGLPLTLSLKGNTSQTGTPTPSTPIPINVVSGDNTIKLMNKNIVQVLNGIWYSSETMVYNTNSQCYGFIARVQPNTTYTLSKKNAGNRYALMTSTDYPAYNVAINRIIRAESDTSRLGETFTTGANDNYVFFGCYRGTDSSAQQLACEEVQIEIGDESSSYIQPQSQTYPITLPVGIELCKIGDYQDYFTKNSSGQWCKYNAIGKVVLDGSENWLGYDYSSSGILYCDDVNNYKTSSNIPLSNNFIGTTNSMNATGFYLSGDLKIGFGNNLTTPRLYLRYDSEYNTSASNIKTWLSTHNTTLYYILQTPYLSLIEDTTLITQLDNIQNAMSYEGQTNISQVNNDIPFKIYASAIKQNTNEVEVENIGNYYATPTLDIEGTGNISIYKDGNQILELDMSSTNEIVIEDMEAYNPNTMELENRKVIGNYKNITCPSGTCIYKVSGDLTKMTITNYTRYL